MGSGLQFRVRVWGLPAKSHGSNVVYRQPNEMVYLLTTLSRVSIGVVWWNVGTRKCTESENSCPWYYSQGSWEVGNTQSPMNRYVWSQSRGSW